LLLPTLEVVTDWLLGSSQISLKKT